MLNRRGTECSGATRRALRFWPLVGMFMAMLAATASRASDQWPQWRGPMRTGVAAGGPELRESLPSQGLQPVWLSEAIPGGGSGGWGSPAIAEDRVYVFVPTRTKRDDVSLPPRQFPPLPPEESEAMSEQAFREYEANRREEELEHSKQFRFEDTLYCFDLDSGETLWKATQPGQYATFVQSVTPAVVDGRVYVLGSGRHAHCFDAESGRQVWSQRLPGEFRDEFFQSSFLVADDVAVVLCGRLFGLDRRDGTLLWQSDGPADAQLHSSPVLWRPERDEPLVICNLPGGKTEAFELRTGEPRWSLESGAGHSTPVVSGDRLLTYGSSRKQGLRCFRLDPVEPEPLWTFRRLADPGSSPVIAGEAVYVQGERKLACVDLETGRAHWQTTLALSNPRYASPIVAGGQLLYAWEGLVAAAATPERFRLVYQAVIDREGTLAAIEDMRRMLEIDQLENDAEGQAKAERRWQQQVVHAGPLACSTPAIAEGRLVLRLRNHLACYELGNDATGDR